MVRLELVTEIGAPVEMVFDAARDLDLHRDSTRQSRERIVAGRASGLAQLGDEITFEARHFGVRQRLTSCISEMNPPTRFVDEMTKGAFRSLRHEHLFRAEDRGTKMVDIFEFEAPLGLLGRLAERLFLASYMRQFLATRNAHLRQICEERAAKLL